MPSMKKRKTNTLDQFFQPKQPLAEPTSMHGITAYDIEETIVGIAVNSIFHGKTIVHG